MTFDFGLTESRTDNAGLVSEPLARSSWVSDASAGIRADYRGPTSTLMVDYRLHSLFYANQTVLNSNQRFLNSAANFDLLEKWLFLDAKAAISQQNRSAFGAATITGVPLTSANRIETTTYQLSPYVRGRVPQLVDYLLRFTSTDSRTSDGIIPVTRTDQWVGGIKNADGAARFGWSLDGDQMDVRSRSQSTRQDARLRATLMFAVDPLLHVSVIGGRERTDYASSARQGSNIYGAGIEWSPTDHTQLAAVGEKRFFGADHLVALTHRTPSTAWSFNSSKDVTVLPNQLAAASPGSVYSLMYDLLASAIPDPTMRADAVRRRLDENGLTSGAALSDSFITTQPYLNRRQEASLALLGIRNTITLTAALKEQQGLGPRTVSTNALAPTEDVRQLGFSASWAHRLSPETFFSLIFSRLHSEGLLDRSVETRQRLQSFFVSTRLGPKTSASMGFRQVRFESTVVNSYNERAFVCSLSLRF
jgi:uncharacterized protein (PEP-CTERM system associated)